MKRYLLCFFLLVLAGCQTLTPNFEAPGVSLISIKALPAQGLEQPFEVGLKLTNPNDKALSIKGISYYLNVEGHKLAEGASGNIPEVPAFGEARFKVIVSTSLFSGLKLLQDVIKNPRDVVAYELVTKVSVSGMLLPSVTVREAGEVNLSAQ